MSAQDRQRWDAAYADRDAASAPMLPAVFGAHEDNFPRTGTALEIACGSGEAAVWLARRGLDVHGVDVSAVAIGRARALAEGCGVEIRFAVHDLDAGLPPGGPVDVLLCHNFRDPFRYADMIARLKPGGLLAVCVLSEVGAAAGRFRAEPRELRAAFAELDIIAAEEGGGQAWMLARRRD
ncbi:class I SAM-dependent methyltransferase [Mycobacterium sp. NPDC003323]